MQHIGAQFVQDSCQPRSRNQKYRRTVRAKIPTRGNVEAPDALDSAKCLVAIWLLLLLEQHQRRVEARAIQAAYESEDLALRAAASQARDEKNNPNAIGHWSGLDIGEKYGRC